MKLNSLFILISILIAGTSFADNKIIRDDQGRPTYKTSCEKVNKTIDGINQNKKTKIKILVSQCGKTNLKDRIYVELMAPDLANGLCFPTKNSSWFYEYRYTVNPYASGIKTGASNYDELSDISDVLWDHGIKNRIDNRTTTFGFFDGRISEIALPNCQ